MMIPIKKRKRITGDERNQLKALLRRKYERGASIRLLAEQTGRSYGFVHRILSESSPSVAEVATPEQPDSRVLRTRAE